jgi:hypothetical protein
MWFIMDTKNKKIVIWDLDNCFEITLAKKLKYELFPNCLIKTRPPNWIPKYNKEPYPNINNKDINIALKDYFFYRNSQPIKEDLSWANLLIHYTPEIINGPWSDYCEQIYKSFNNKNFITIASGSCELNEYPTDKTYFKLAHFFSNIAEHCHQEEYNKEKEKLKMFDVLLGISKPHRMFILENILKSGLEDVSFINIWKGPNNFGLNYRSKDLDRFEDPAVVNQINIGSSTIIVAGIKNGYCLAQSIPTEIYKNSWYSIVAETNWMSNDFFTEKTAKCFFAKRIFIFFGKQGQLKKLRELGYKTFDNIIDESYDEIENDVERWSFAFKEVIKLSKLDPLEVYSKANNILEHNKQEVLNQIKRLELLKNFLQTHLSLLK